MNSNLVFIKNNLKVLFSFWIKNIYFFYSWTSKTSRCVLTYSFHQSYSYFKTRASRLYMLLSFYFLGRLAILVLKGVECVCSLAGGNLMFMSFSLWVLSPLFSKNSKTCGIQNGLVDGLKSRWQWKQPWGSCNDLGI